VGEPYRKGESFDFERFDNFKFCMDHLRKNGIEAPEAEIRKVLDPKQVMLSYGSLGGTGPEAVRPMLARLREGSATHRRRLEADQARVQKGYDACRSIAREASQVKVAGDLARLIESHRPGKRA
jgi:hypothetical protein